jgi:hypothetical protein
MIYNFILFLGDREWGEDDFFIFKTPDNQLIIQWSDANDFEDEGYEILGKVVLCTVPFTSKMIKKVCIYLFILLFYFVI